MAEGDLYVIDVVVHLYSRAEVGQNPDRQEDVFCQILVGVSYGVKPFTYFLVQLYA